MYTLTSRLGLLVVGLLSSGFSSLALVTSPFKLRLLILLSVLISIRRSVSDYFRDSGSLSFLWDIRRSVFLIQ